MPSSHPTRREFAVTLAAAALTACAGRGVHTSSAPAAIGAASTSSKPDPNAPIADLLAGVVAARYGGALDAEQRKQVRGGILHTLQLSDRLRAVTLPNAVDPFSSLCVSPSAASAGVDR